MGTSTGSMANLKDEIFRMYEQEIGGGQCSKCRKYDDNLPDGEKRVGPLSFFHIGKNMADKNSEKRIVFVGKTSWISEKEAREYEWYPGEGRKIIRDASGFGEEAWNITEDDKKDYKNSRWKHSGYWNYVRDITSALDLTLDDIAITNLVKCNIYDETAEDKPKNITDDIYFERCIPIFEKEIKIIKPTHVILFVGRDYDGHIKKLNFGGTLENINNDNYDNDKYKTETKTKGGEKRKVWWWHRKFYRSDGTVLHLLRTRHPQGAPGGLKEKIINWARDPDSFQAMK